MQGYGRTMKKTVTTAAKLITLFIEIIIKLSFE